MAGRNEMCGCGSRKKHKHCCWGKLQIPGYQPAVPPQHAITPEIAQAFEERRIAYNIRHGREPKLGDGILKDESIPTIETPPMMVEFFSRDTSGGDTDATEGRTGDAESAQDEVESPSSGGGDPN